MRSVARRGAAYYARLIKSKESGDGDRAGVLDARARLDPTRYAGHSLRALLVTSAATAGASERVIMAQTGHRSAEMVRRYIREGDLFRGEWTDLWKKGALL